MPPTRASRRSPAEVLEGWSGRVFLGIGRALYVGPAADTGVHAHHAIQIALAIDRPFRLRASADDRWRRYDSAVVPSNQSHQLDGSGSEVVLLYLEPESEGGARTTRGAGTPGFERLQRPTRDAIRGAVLSAASQTEFDGAAADRLFSGILHELGIPGHSAAALDDRIRQAIDRVRSEPGAYRSVSAIAGSVGLSPRRFRDLFTAEIGMSCRQYLLWMRLQAAIRESARGATLTNAACAAGFADAAHLTRTFRRMFGIAPSSVHRSITLMH